LWLSIYEGTSKMAVRSFLVSRCKRS